MLKLRNRQLAFDDGEIAELLAEIEFEDQETAIAIVRSLTDGWPLIVSIAIDRLVASDDPSATLRSLSRRGLPANTVPAALTSALSDTDSQALRSLAQLAVFDTEMAALCGVSGLEQRVLAGGIPLFTDANGGLRLPAPLKRALLEDPVAAVPVADAVPGYMVAAGRTEEAVEACLAAGRLDTATRIVSELTLEQLPQLDPGWLQATVTTVGAFVETYPRALCVLGRVFAMNSRFDEGLAPARRVGRSGRPYQQADRRRRYRHQPWQSSRCEAEPTAA